MNSPTVIATTAHALPAFAQLKMQPSAVQVYRPPEPEIARRVLDSLAVLDKHVGAVVSHPREPTVITDFWSLPVLGGLGLAGVLHWMGLEGAGLSMLLGGAASALTLCAHPFVKRHAKTYSNPLLGDEAREAVLGLEHAKTDFEPAEGGRFEAPEVDAALATRARHWLEVCKENRITDRQLIGVLEDVVKRDAPLSDEEQARLARTVKFIEAFGHWDAYGDVLELFNGLSDEDKRAIAPFLRERGFTAEGPSKRATREDMARALHAALEAASPTFPPFEIKIGTSLLNGTKPNIIDTLENVVECEALLRKSKHEAFEDATEAFAYAKSDKRTALERVLIGAVAKRILGEPQERETYQFRRRHALAELVAIGEAQPDEARARGKVITENIDASDMTLAQNLRVLKLREA